MISNQNSYPGVTTEKSLANEFFTKARVGLVEDSKAANPQGIYTFKFDVSEILNLNKSLSMETLSKEIKNLSNENSDLVINSIVYVSRPEIKNMFTAEFKKV